ncbi:MAG: small basic family protein [Propionibacteriaceae bacterium]|nr:small basic family protein [Propionibacteriaceae bacterium]
MLAVLGLIAGVVIGLLVEPTLPTVLQPYLPIAIVAALDAILGAARAWFEGVFSDRVFVVSFLSNVLIAGLIVFVGDQIGVGSQLSTGVVVVLGIRIFNNVAAIRRAVLHA